MRLTWHNYRYYPYERELAVREIAALLDNPELREVPDGFELIGGMDSARASRLTYFAGVINGHGLVHTAQSRLESAARLGKGRQATRYSVHGLHEYKGKFNPQVAKAILNIFGVVPGQRVLDPFCGSGTTLVECAQLGALGYGADLNPLAVYLANAKLQALATPAAMLKIILGNLCASLNGVKRWKAPIADDERGIYLAAWFEPDILQIIEIVNAKIYDTAETAAPVFLAIASNLLREYSLQDPHDLRIRRRKSPLPETPFVEALLAACAQSIERIEAAQAVVGTDIPPGQAVERDITTLQRADVPAVFDAAITSPPYAMALPYIDTQRLSLVWLGLLEPQRILALESELIGSRELRGSGRKDLAARMIDNEADLPEPQAAFCRELQQALGPHDGFRRQAVPVLLYRYFGAMQRSFRAVRGLMRQRAPFALIVGHNHTVLGGVRYDIDTPSHLAGIASAIGWTVEEMLPLQTYQRYGYHMGNAIESETLIILRNP